MADEDEIDILGDFSFNSCFAQNSQGIPSCSNREDTVHPQWLLDSPAANWYDTQNIDKNRTKEGMSRKLSGNNATIKHDTEQHTAWSPEERDLLKNEMVKHGRNISRISQTLKTKSEAEIRALIEAEHGILLDTPLIELEKHGEEDIPVVQEEIVTDELVNMNDVLSMVTTGAPTIPVTKKTLKKKNTSAKKSPIKKKINIATNVMDTTELFYEDDLVIGSTEYVGSDASVDEVPVKGNLKREREKVKTVKKIGNHRRKVARNCDKSKKRNKSKDKLKSPQVRQRKESSLSNDSVKSPHMQILLGSGSALPVSEGEQIIKIEKKNSDSDIEVDIDSDTDCSLQVKAAPNKVEKKEKEPDETPIAVPLRKFEPMPKRNRKINLDGGGGYTIMHTESGDLYEIGQEPRKERPQRKPAVELYPCRFYSADKPAPCEVSLHASALCLMDAHAHSSVGEVMGLVGGRWAAPRLRLRLYRRARAAAAPAHCDMEPASQAAAASWLCARAAPPAAWHHSHPRFPAAPSATDLRQQRALQTALARRTPFLALVTSQHWPRGRSASTLRCFHVEDDEATDVPVGYQFSVKIIPDFTRESIPEFLEELRDLWCSFSDRDQLSVNLPVDVCPQAGMTYLEKYISSMRHHMHSAGYEDNDPLIDQLVKGVRDIFR